MILTPNGYKSIEDINIGDDIIAYDINTGEIIINKLLNKELIENDALLFYNINNNWNLYEQQSIWANMRVVHVKDLSVGDTIYNDLNEDIIIESIFESYATNWWRLEVSGDHSYILDGITVHNASRYWVGGGSSSNWNATTNTNWGSSSGTQDNSSVPTSSDDVIFDGQGVGGNSDATINVNTTISSLTVSSGYTKKWTYTITPGGFTCNGNVTLSNNFTVTGSAISNTPSLSLSGSTTLTMNDFQWHGNIYFIGSGNPTKTLVGDLIISGGFIGSNSNQTINRTTNENIYITNGNYSTVSGIMPFYFSGTADIYLRGGIWYATSNYYIYNNLFLDGNVQIGSGSLYPEVYYGTKTLKYLSGNITYTTNGRISIASTCNFDLSSMVLRSLTSGGGNNILWLSSSLICNEISCSSNTFTITSSNFSVTSSQGFNPVGNIVFNVPSLWSGGTWVQNSTSVGISAIRPMTISGSVTMSGIYPTIISGSFNFISGSGNIQTNGSTLNIAGNSILNLPTVNLNNLNMISTNVTNLSSSLYISGTLTILGNTTFTGSNGWSCTHLSSSSTSIVSMSLTPNNVYYITSSMNLTSNPIGSNLIIQSNNATTKSILTLQNDASCIVSSNFTRINASNGRIIRTFNGTITNCDNIEQLNDLGTIATAFIGNANG